MKEIRLGDFTIGGAKPVFIMGPCVIEDEATTLATLEGLKRITSDLKIPFVFKASYDKANRTSAASFRGPGIKEGLRILRRVSEEFFVPVLTDVHCSHDVDSVAAVANIIQIPAFLCRQTDLIIKAASTGRIINIKKGQFLSPADMSQSVDKALSAGNDMIIVTERGTSFGYNNLVVDYRGLPVLRALGYPVFFDAPHSVQTPGGLGTCSGGDRTMAVHLARAAAAVGVDGFFFEVHPDPDNALCDGPNSIKLSDVRGLLEEIIAIDALGRVQASR